MRKVAVMGDKASVLCFKAFGVDVFDCIEANVDENRKLLDSLVRDGYGTIFVTEQVGVHLEYSISRYMHQVMPIIVLIPNNKGTLGIGLKKISDNVEKAIGINILDEGR